LTGLSTVHRVEGAARLGSEWREHLQIHSDDVDFTKRATAEAVCRYFLEAAWNHAVHLGIGYGDLARQNRLWVLARLFVQLEALPEWGQTVELTTWPRGTSTVFAVRDFELVDTAAKRLAAGSSNWLVLEAASRRPQRPDKLLLGIPSRIDRLAVGREARKLPTFEAGVMGFTTQVRYSDIDVNRHVNSARYLAWLLDSYSADFHREHTLRAMELNYVGETLWEETVQVYSHQRSSMQFAHRISKSDGTEVCRAELTWASSLRE
jgi:medium-chain acyl-[acyl-carrier-protein] hydrolase